MKLKSLKLMAIATFLASSFNVSAEVININDASVTAISHYLKGIGEVKANSIVSYRELNGDFKSLDDLVKVKGIGKGLLKKNREDLSLTEGIVKWIKSKPKLVVINKESSAKGKLKKLDSEKLVSNTVSDRSKKKVTSKIAVDQGPSKAKAAKKGRPSEAR